jgi:hypothetical protein
MEIIPLLVSLRLYPTFGGFAKKPGNFQKIQEKK